MKNSIENNIIEINDVKDIKEFTQLIAKHFNDGIDNLNPLYNNAVKLKIKELKNNIKQEYSDNEFKNII